MKKISVDCVDMVRKIRDRLYLETKGMTKDELIAFYSQPPKVLDSKNRMKRNQKVA